MATDSGASFSFLALRRLDILPSTIGDARSQHNAAHKTAAYPAGLSGLNLGLPGIGVSRGDSEP